MGGILSHRLHPITTKKSSDEINEKLICGSSSMQGYRITQEDAHNCILDFDTNTSLFAVYDGHGGHEVARYCSRSLPEFIKESQAYKDGDLEKALVEGFLGFDATLTTPKIKKILCDICSEKDSEEDESSADEEENLTNLYEEAHMPIEKVIEKYCNSEHKSTAKKEQDDMQAVASSSTSSSSEASSSRRNSRKEPIPDSNGGCSSSTDGVSSSCIEVDSTENVVQSEQCPDISENSTQQPASSKNEAESCVEQSEPIQNDDGNDVSSSSSQENGEVPKKSKGKALMKTKGVEPIDDEELSAVLNQRKEELKGNMQYLYKQFLASLDDENEENEEETDSSEEEESEDEAEKDEEDDDDDKEEEDEEEEEEDGKGDGSDEETETDLMLFPDERGPGFESGSTAVMALLRNNQLYVANTGDSRCILCRNGQAVDMSIDHIPEDTEERKRILAAGGKIKDGRVNDGLNLSRAIGDFLYKRNPNLSDREQMITALPDIKTTTIVPGEDEFLVIACDGIWNDMTSQEVVDFVRPRLEKHPEKLSKIIEEMFDYCLEKKAMDNMTAIIVQFKSSDSSCKRSLDTTTENDEPCKKTKTDTNEPQVDTTE